MRKSFTGSLCIIVLLLCSRKSLAGEFRTSCYAEIACSSNITDIVTDRFTKRFPVKRYEIVAYVNGTTFDDGVLIAYAAVGVSPREYGKYEKLSLFPLNRYEVSWHGALDGNTTLQIREIQVLRRAVQDLMRRCATAKGCNILDSN